MAGDGAVTTYFPFVQSTIAAPTFQPTLDGEIYSCSVNWNSYANRYYLLCLDANGNLIFNVAVITSPPAQTLSNLSWNPATLLVTATVPVPHGFKLGTIVNLTISGANPTGYNGEFNVSVTSPTSFTYPLSSDPGQIASPGSASWQVNLCKGYFASSIVFRNSQFEVSP